MRFSDAEWKAMNVVWERHPATVRDVLESLESDTGWAYSTVKTVLGRLAEKGALAATKRANTTLFEPLVTRDQARRSALRALLDRAFDGTFGGLVHHLLDAEKLTRTERDELRALLDEAGSSRRPRSRR